MPKNAKIWEGFVKRNLVTNVWGTPYLPSKKPDVPLFSPRLKNLSMLPMPVYNTPNRWKLSPRRSCKKQAIKIKKAHEPDGIQVDVINSCSV